MRTPSHTDLARIYGILDVQTTKCRWKRAAPSEPTPIAFLAPVRRRAPMTFAGGPPSAWPRLMGVEQKSSHRHDGLWLRRKDGYNR